MKYKVYVDWLTQWGKDYLSHLKQIFQGKLTAGEGVTIDENNVISTDGSFDDYMRKENPVGSGYLGMNLPTDDDGDTIYPGRNAMVGGRANRGTGQNGLTVGHLNENTNVDSIVCGSGNEIKSGSSITCGGNNENPTNGSGTNSIMAGTGNSNRTRNMLLSGSNNITSYNGFGNGAIVGSDNSTASPHSFIFGDDNTINANSQYVRLIGNDNTATGNDSVAVGNGNTATGGGCKVIGDNNTVNQSNVFGDYWTKSTVGGYLIGTGCNLDDIAERVSLGGNMLFGVGGNVVAGLTAHGELNLGFGLDYEEDLSDRVLNIIEFLQGSSSFRYKASLFKDGRMKGADPINNDEFTTKQFVESYFEFLDNYSEEEF